MGYIAVHAMDRPLNLPWWRKKLAIQVAGVMAAVLLVLTTMALFLGAAERSVRIKADTLTFSTAEHGIFHDFVPLRGKTVPHDTIYLDALEGGQVERVLVRPGDRVQINQPLVIFRNSQLELEVLDEVGRLVESITQLQTYQTELETNRVANEKALEDIDFNIKRLQLLAARQDPLMARGIVSVLDDQQTHNELDHDLRLRPLQAETNQRQEQLRLQQLPRIQTELASLQQSLQIARSKVDDLTVKAPVAGLVTAIDLKVGQNRNRGDRLVEIVPNTGFKLAADIDEYYRDRVRSGQTADAEIDGMQYRLRVTRVYPQVQNGVFTAELEFQGTPPPNLVAGAAIEGKLSLGSDQRALILPAAAFLERTGGDWAFVVDAGGQTAHRRTLKIGRRSLEQVEVLNGLRPGERLITSDYTGLERIDRIDLTK